MPANHNSATGLPVNVTPSDSVIQKYRAFRYGGASAANIAVIGIDDESNDGAGTSVTIPNVQPGEVVDIAVKKIMATNTAAAANTITGYP